MNQNPAERRGWVQTGGMPVDDIHRDMREAIDRVDRVQYIGGACFKMFDRAGAQIGIVQMQGAEGARLDDAVMATTQRLALGEERKPDPLAGDTIVRELDLRNPGDADLYARARSGEMAAVSFPDIERTDPPPINLPDYINPDREPVADDREMQRIEGGRWLLIVTVFAIATIVAGIIGFALTAGSASHG